MNKPFKTYNGGKESDGTFQKIINIMPPHDIYIEAFLGNGAIYRHKKPAVLASIGIDLDPLVIDTWNNAAIPGINCINTDAISFLENFLVLDPIFKKMGTEVLIYLDPPYPKSSRRNSKNLYRHEMTDADHTRLLNVVTRLKSNVIVSSYPNVLYNDLLRDWSTKKFTAQTRNGTATEKIWYNFPTPVQLHDYRYIGNDYREREQLKGIITRNVAKFNRLPAVQRNAIIHQLKNQNLL
jgi:site-specific DNA-adenine methylase